MKQLIIDWLICSVVMVVIVATITTLCADERTDYLKARAAIAIHASQSHPVPAATDTSIPKTDSRSSKPEPDEKPLLFMYTTSNCEPCETAKRELKASKALPFTVVFDRKPNIEIEAYPTFHWTTKSGGWTLEGWHGVKHLENEWKRSQSQPIAAVPTLRTRRAWTFPGDVKSHLMQEHGLTANELRSLSTEQAVQLDSALREGYSLSQIRSYARARGMIR